MNGPLFETSTLRQAFIALRKDLISDQGPSISTMRNYRFAIVQYQPKEEFELRGEVQRLSADLMANGWMVLSLNLQQMLLDRVRAQPENWTDRVIATEKRMHDISPERGLNYLKSKIAPLIEGPGGLAADCARIIGDYAEAHPDTADRTVALIGRAGALYPFFRSSALLRHIDGQTHNIPVVLLYPGERRGATGLSFMGILDPDNDYRPRIYP